MTRPATLRVRTERIADERPLLDLLATLPGDDRTAFVREGEGLVTAGRAATVAVARGHGRLSRARAALDALADSADVVDDVDLAGTGLVAVGSFTFDDGTKGAGGADAGGGSGSVLHVPAVIVGRRSGVTWRTTIVGEAGGADGAAPERSGGEGHAGWHRSGAEEERDRPRYAGSTLGDAAWLEAVDRTVTAIRDGRAEKAVLARDVHLWSRTAFATGEVLTALAERFPSCFTFLVDGLVGASPELLLRREGGHVASRVLAGTARRGTDAQEDARLGAELLASRKDRWEHDLAARSVIEVLAGLCSEVSAPDAPSLVVLDNVQHLGSGVSGTLTEPAHVLDVLDLLHPTAAVAGTPRDAALALIREVEGMDRGRYAGPVGWCDASGDGEFAIALRCAEIDGTRARLFAGAGIVDGSLPEAELMETWLKLRAMTDVLTRR